MVKPGLFVSEYVLKSNRFIINKTSICDASPYYPRLTLNLVEANKGPDAFCTGLGDLLLTLETSERLYLK